MKVGDIVLTCTGKGKILEINNNLYYIDDGMSKEWYTEGEIN